MTGKEESERSKELEDARLVALSNSSLFVFEHTGATGQGIEAQGCTVLANASDSEDMKY